MEKDFTAFFDGERIDACEKMQKVYGSEKEREVGIFYPRLACMIFEVKYPKIAILHTTFNLRTYTQNYIPTMKRHKEWGVGS